MAFTPQEKDHVLQPGDIVWKHALSATADWKKEAENLLRATGKSRLVTPAGLVLFELPE